MKQDVSKVVISRDNLVRFWNVFSQTWELRDASGVCADSRIMESLPESQRVRIRTASLRIERAGRTCARAAIEHPSYAI
jgi:hypothetical protein